MISFRAKLLCPALLLPLLPLLSLLPLIAAVQGTVTNGTTGKPQSGVTVNVLKLEGGMVPIGKDITGPDGRFHIEAPPPSGNLPYLVRADYKSVGYFAPARAAEGSVALKVYDTTGEAAAFRLSGHQVILEPHQGQLMVLESYTISNASQPPKTYLNRDGFRFTLPNDNVTEMSVSATGPGQLPLRQSAESKGQGKYAMDYSFRPGDTRVEINYKLPYTDSYKFRAPLMAGLEETEIIAPSDAVTITGEDRKSVV